MSNIYKPDNSDKGYEKYMAIEGYEEVPEGWTDTPYPQPSYRPRYDWVKNVWVETIDHNEVIEEHKRGKISDLKRDCTEAILGRFKAKIRKKEYTFSYDTEAQLNFQDTYNLFQNDLLGSISWTVSVGEVKERIKLSKQEFSSVYVEAIRHKNVCLDYLHETLLKKLTLAKTIKEVEAISWEKPKSEIIFDTSNMLDKKVKSIDEVAKDSTAQKAYNGYTETMLMEVIDIALMGTTG